MILSRDIQVSAVNEIINDTLEELILVWKGRLRVDITNLGVKIERAAVRVGADWELGKKVLGKDFDNNGIDGSLDKLMLINGVFGHGNIRIIQTEVVNNMSGKHINVYNGLADLVGDLFFEHRGEHRGFRLA